MRTKLLSLVFFFFFFTVAVMAQNPDGGSTAAQLSKGAPIGGGLLILATMGVGYAISRIYRMRRQYQEIME